MAQETAVHTLSRTLSYSKVLRGEVKGLGKGVLFTKSKPAVSIEEGSVGVIKGNDWGRVAQAFLSTLVPCDAYGHLPSRPLCHQGPCKNALLPDAKLRINVDFKVRGGGRVLRTCFLYHHQPVGKSLTNVGELGPMPFCTHSSHPYFKAGINYDVLYGVCTATKPPTVRACGWVGGCVGRWVRGLGGVSA